MKKPIYILGDWIWAKELARNHARPDAFQQYPCQVRESPVNFIFYKLIGAKGVLAEDGKI
ncbi:MAG: hypothetical protein V3U73_14025 [bacterium]